MILDRITFTGADGNMSADELYKLSERFKKSEWGILYYPEKMFESRYPYGWWVNNFLVNKPEDCHVSIHFCGDITRGLYESKPESSHPLWEFLNKYHDKIDRVQMNFPKSTLALRDVGEMFSGKFVENIGFMSEQWDIQTILQANEGTEVLVAVIKQYDIPGVCFLQDASRGSGISGDVTLPPVRGYPTGYAGGFNPENVIGKLTTLCFITLPEHGHTWIDMESGVRSCDKRSNGTEVSNFDIYKVTSVLEQVSGIKWTH